MVQMLGSVHQHITLWQAHRIGNAIVDDTESYVPILWVEDALGCQECREKVQVEKGRCATEEELTRLEQRLPRLSGR